MSFLVIASYLSLVGPSQADNTIVFAANSEVHTVQAAVYRAESRVTSFTVILAGVLRDNSFFPYE